MLAEDGITCGSDCWTLLMSHSTSSQDTRVCSLIIKSIKMSEQVKKPAEIFFSRKAANSSTETLRRKPAKVHSCTFRISAHTRCFGRNKAGEGKQWSCCPAQPHQTVQLANAQLLLTVYLRPPCKEELGHLLAARLAQLGSCPQFEMKKNHTVQQEQSY